MAALGVHFQKQECPCDGTATQEYLPCLKCITCGLISNKHPGVSVREDPEALVTPQALSCLCVSHLVLPVVLTGVSAVRLCVVSPLATFLGWGV